jgi:hypothetical protein
MARGGGYCRLRGRGQVCVARHASTPELLPAPSRREIPPATRRRYRGPGASPAGAVPADHGVRLDDDERRSPARPGTREPRPEQAIRPREARSSGQAREHHELLAQAEVLQGDVAPRAYGAAQEAPGEPKVGEQGAASFRTDAVRLARTPSSVNQSDSDEILGPHSLSSMTRCANVTSIA